MTSIVQTLKEAQTLLGESRSGEILLAHILNQSRAYLYTYPEEILDSTQLQQFETLIQRRKQGEPIAYLLGEKEFYSLNFKVTQDTLIPRPETELIIDKALELLPDTPLSILELGTGSGAIAVTLAKLRPHWKILATDISAPALQIAKYNAKQYQLTNINFILSNWFENIPAQKFNMIISNPPYVAAHDVHLEELHYEPISALQAGEQGLDCLKIIIKNSGKYLESKGWLLLEHGYDQEQAVQTLLKNAQFESIQTVRDLANVSRLSLGRSA